MSLSNRTVFIILVIIVSFEAIVLLNLAKDLGVLGGDGPTYNNLALNLITKGLFSSQSDYPYEPTIFRSIGYPLFLGSIYNLVGNSVAAIRFAQFILLLFSSYLLFLLAKRFAGENSAFYAAVFCAAYLPLAFLCLYHLTEILSTFLVILSVYLVVKIEEGSNKSGILLGLTLGCLSQVRPSFLLFAGLILVAVFISNKIIFKTKLTVAISIIIALTLCIFPWAIRNKIVSGEFVPLATGKGVSLYVSAQQYQGDISYSIPLSDWVKIIEEDNRRGLDSREKINALDLRQESTSLNLPLNPRIELLQDKTYTTNAFEKFSTIPIKNYLFGYPKRIAYLFSTSDAAPANIYDSTHPLVQLQFAIFAFLILVGVMVQRKLILQQYLLWLVPIYIIVLHTIFHVESRYSIPAKPFLLIYAGIGINFLFKQFMLMRGTFLGKEVRDMNGIKKI
jgi:4-amino-4-deoxy-L-arabinose transferase-like glycosyltransferase